MKYVGDLSRQDAALLEQDTRGEHDTRGARTVLEFDADGNRKTTVRKKDIGMNRFKLTLRHASIGDSHPDIGKVQQFLRRFGYLRPAVKESTLDVSTSEALKAFQSIMRVAPSGTLDPATAEALERRRCGISDAHLLDGSPKSSTNYVLRGCSYLKISFTHRFDNGTPDILDDQERGAVQRAFQTWADALCGVSVVEVSGNTDFASGWFTGDHGDGTPFDGPGNVLAHAFYPPPCGGSFAGHMHFDDAEDWSLTGAGGTVDMETVALHEIGHLLGLAHSSDPNAIMYPTYTGVMRSLGQDDVAGIRRLYPYFCRRKDSGNQAGGVLEIDTAASSDGQIVVNAVRTLAGTLKLIAWDVDLVSRIGDSGLQAGEATLIQIARNRNSDQYVTACRTATGILKLISWNVSSSGTIARRADSRNQGGTVSIVRLVAVSNDFFVTAVREGTQLRLIGWRLNADGSLARLSSSVLSDVASEIDVVRISDSRVATAIRDSSGTLKVVAWQVSPTSVFRLGDSGTQAGAASLIRSAVDGFGNVVTAVRDGSGRLKLIVWQVTTTGAVVRLSDSGVLADEGTTTHDVAFALGYIISAMRTNAGALKAIAWSTSGNNVSRIGDSAFLAAAIAQVSLSGDLAGTSFVTCAQVPELQLISWRQ